MVISQLVELTSEWISGRDFVDEVLEMKQRSVRYRQPFGAWAVAKPGLMELVGSCWFYGHWLLG